MSDISGLISSSGIALEQEAFNQFGAAISNQTNTALSGAFNSTKNINNVNDASEVVKNTTSGDWNPTPYASAFTNFQGGFDPKIKFLFKVKFKFHEEAAQMASSLGVDLHDLSRDLSYTIKKIDLPKVQFDYETVNMYNFRTKVLKSISNRELSMEFYDVTANHSLNFINIYMMLYKPISRTRQSPTVTHEDHGFAFNDNYLGLDTAFRGVIPGNRKDMISEMIIEQFYMNLGGTGNQVNSDITKINRFIFTNPRLESMDFSDQDHENGSSVNIISASFNFDALHVEVAQSVTNTETASYAAGDLLSFTESPTTILPKSVSSPGKSNNPFALAISRQGQRMVQTTASSLLNRSLSINAGGVLQNSIYEVNSAFGQLANNTLQNVNNGIISTISVNNSPYISDTSVSSNDIKNLSTRHSSLDK